jgi:uncharacterized protein with HEPN domain
MSPEERDPACLWDMLEAAKKVARFTKGVRRAEYLADAMMQDAVERNLGVIGEAARRLSQGFKEAHPEIPWRKIVALRNVLVHEYDEVDQGEIWGLVTRHVPALIEQLTALIPPLPPEELE